MQNGWLVLGLVSLCVALLGCSRRTSSRVEAARDEAAPKQISWDARFVVNEGGQRRAALAAAQMERYDRGDSTFALLRSRPDSVEADSVSRRVRAWLFDAEGDSSATLTSDSLIYYDQRGQFEAFGNVIVVTESEKRLETEFLTWSEGDRQMRTDRFVQITTPSEYVEGHGLVAEEDLETYQIGRFTAQVTLDEGETPPDSSSRR